MSTYNRIMELSEKLASFDLVPSSGPASTVEGECVRAWHMMTYRHYNDGDDIYYEDGNSANGAFNFLTGEMGFDDVITSNNAEEDILAIGNRLLDVVEDCAGAYSPNDEGYDYLEFCRDYEEDDYSDWEEEYDEA